VTDLDFPDWRGIQELKRFRIRSLSSTRFRDDALLRRYVSVRPHIWVGDSPLRPYRDAVLHLLDEVRHAKAMGDSDGVDEAWVSTIKSVDALIAEGERLNGRRVSIRM